MFSGEGEAVSWLPPMVPLPPFTETGIVNDPLSEVVTSTLPL